MSGMAEGSLHAPLRRVRTVFLVAIAALAALGPLAAAQSEAPAGDDPPPALASIGLAGGFPAYQTATVRIGLQGGFVGADVRIGYGPQSGLSFGAAVRGYPPIPGSPVPVWVGGGVMATGGSAAPFAAAGAHVPVAQRVRIDVEAGAAWTRLGLETQVVPHVLIGLSYAFAVEAPARTSTGAPDVDARGDGARDGCERSDPDPDRLDAALRDAEARFVADARATYGSLYRSLSYDLDVRSERIDGTRAVIELTYDGSVVEIASGNRIAASGTAEATFRWTGCGWSWTGLDY